MEKDSEARKMNEKKQLKNYIENRRIVSYGIVPKKSEMKFIDLFSGIGGFRYGISEATYGEWKCVWACDIDKYATAVYNYRFRTEYKPTDVRTVDPQSVPDFDLLCAGFPCQSFSIAGKRKGFEDTRGTLFFEICRFLEVKRPSYLFLENVKGLLNHEKGRTFTIILQSLAELGYDLQWMVLNSRFFGVPQNRERVFIIGNLREKPRPEILPFGKNGRETQAVAGETGKGRSGMENEAVATTIKQGSKWSDTMIVHNIYHGFGEEEPRFFKNYSPTIRTPAGGGHIPAVLMNTITEAVGTRQGSSKEFLSSVSAIELSGCGIRRLTPLECERLQGFPDGWTEKGILDGKEIKISDTQRYKMLGNAVTVNVIKAIVSNWR